MTNESRVHRKLAPDPYYHNCRIERETVLHVLRDCNNGKWHNQKTPKKDSPLNCTPTATIRSLVAETMFANEIDANSLKIIKQDNMVSWKYTPKQWMELKVDGCSNGNLENAGSGGIIQDRLVSWVRGFAMNIVFSNSVKADRCWAMITGLVNKARELLAGEKFQFNCVQRSQSSNRMVSYF